MNAVQSVWTLVVASFLVQIVQFGAGFDNHHQWLNLFSPKKLVVVAEVFKWPVAEGDGIAFGTNGKMIMTVINVYVNLDSSNDCKAFKHTTCSASCYIS